MDLILIEITYKNYILHTRQFVLQGRHGVSETNTRPQEEGWASQSARGKGKEARRGGKVLETPAAHSAGLHPGPSLSAHCAEPRPSLPLHPGPCWQVLLPMLAASEEMKGKSDLPLIGLTVGN